MQLGQRAGQTVFKDLLESDTVNIEKLKQYVQKQSIVTEFKPLCWKILLGIKSPYRATRRYVDQANCDIYKRLHSTLTTCQIIQNDTSISQQFLSMYLLDSHAIKIPITSTKEYESFLSTANFICSFLDNDNEQRLDVIAECWFMTCKMYDKFIHLTRRIAFLRYHVGKIAQQEFVYESKLLLHLNTHNIFVSIPENWLKDGFQLIRDDFSLLNIWEKFIAGSEYIFVFLTIHILHYCRGKLLSLYSTKEIIQYLIDLKIDDQAACEHIAIASVASWKKQGNSLLSFPAIP
ncbi:unnamed protein product [Adineta steineri]|uniref:TBC1 domain family member 7 n=2 Tax=Adineta steineri TaxID=433720 RepID=A0A819PIR9_9BILA|nr:unnamed protein product [Adineta steineri]